MKRGSGLVLALGLLLAAIGAVAQSDLAAFPAGTTTMLYHVNAEDISEPQVLELVVTSYGNDRYTVRMVTEQTGNEDELASGFGFIFGAASVSSGGGHGADFSSLNALMDQRSRLQEGQDYLLPGGGSFENIVGLTIAGVWCLEGEFVNPSDTDKRMTIAFALTHPVYISPRIVAEELRQGVWVETFRLELVEYSHVESKG